MRSINTEKDLESIIYFDIYPDFSSGGTNDLDGFQIFTPEFIVKDMLKLIGEKNIRISIKQYLNPRVEMEHSQLEYLMRAYII